MLPSEREISGVTTKPKQNAGNRTDRRGHGPGFHQTTDAIRKQVEALASYGVAKEHIAKVVGICVHTLSKHYAETLATAAVKANSLIAQSLFNKATRGDGQASTTACIFWLKASAGWREKDVHEISGPNGGPIPTLDLTLARWRSHAATASATSAWDDLLAQR